MEGASSFFSCLGFWGRLGSVVIREVGTRQKAIVVELIRTNPAKVHDFRSVSIRKYDIVAKVQHFSCSSSEIEILSIKYCTFAGIY